MAGNTTLLHVFGHLLQNVMTALPGNELIMSISLSRRPPILILLSGGVGTQARRSSKAAKARRADYMAAILKTLQVSQFLTTLPITEAYYGIPDWLIFNLL